MRIGDDELRLRVARRLAARDANDRRPDVFDTECVEDERQHYLGMADVAIEEIREAEAEAHPIVTASTYTPWRYRTLKLVADGHVVYDPSGPLSRPYRLRLLVESAESARYEVRAVDARTDRYLSAMRIAGVIAMTREDQRLWKVSLTGEGRKLYDRWTPDHHKD